MKANLPIFFTSWWLDAVCKYGEWGICTSKLNNGEVVGVLPYYLTSYFGFRIIRTPLFTPYLGVWLDYSSCSKRLHYRYSFETKVIGELINQLPKVTYYHQIHPEQLQNWLPFYWRGFKQSTRYTYVLNESDPERVFEKMKGETRTRIRKAGKLFSISENNNDDDFMLFFNRTMKRQNVSLIKHKKIFKELHAAIQSKQAGKIYWVLNQEGLAAAAVYMIWDNNTSYYWLPCLDKNVGSQGAAQLLLWHTIQEAFKMGKRYNFEGSMLPHIEPVFRAFGAERKPIHQLYKCSNRLLYAVRTFLKS